MELLPAAAATERWTRAVRALTATGSSATEREQQGDMRNGVREVWSHGSWEEDGDTGCGAGGRRRWPAGAVWRPAAATVLTLALEDDEQKEENPTRE